MTYFFQEERKIYIVDPERIFRGDDVLLKCNISDNTGIFKVRWYFAEGDKKELWSSNSEKYCDGTISSPSLLIKKVDETDSGTYRCDIVYEDGSQVTSQRKLAVPKCKCEFHLAAGNITFHFFARLLFFFIESFSFK